MTKLTRHKTFFDLKSTPNSINYNPEGNNQENIELEELIKLLKEKIAPKKRRKTNKISDGHQFND